MYKIKFTLGDWSDDGHCMKDVFIVESTLPVDDLREVHFKANDLLGFDIGSLCSDYGDSSISRERYEKLEKFLSCTIYEDIDDDFWEENENEILIDSPKDLLHIWLDCLEKTEPGLKLKVIDDDIPNIHFYGRDKKNRHLNTPGYGLFHP